MPETLIEDDFNSLITNEFAFWNPTDPASKKSPTWEMSSGSLFNAGGAGSTGSPDNRQPDALSSKGNNSCIFRLRTVRKDFLNTEVSFILLNNGFVSSQGTPPVDWDGVHVWTRYQSEFSLYYASVNRRDGVCLIKKKVPGGPSNDGTYYTISKIAKLPVPLGRWQQIKVVTKNPTDKSVLIQLYVGGALIVEATDSGKYGAPLVGAGRVGIRGDNCNFMFDTFKVAKL